MKFGEVVGGVLALVRACAVRCALCVEGGIPWRIPGVWDGFVVGTGCGLAAVVRLVPVPGLPAVVAGAHRAIGGSVAAIVVGSPCVL